MVWKLKFIFQEVDDDLICDTLYFRNQKYAFEKYKYIINKYCDILKNNEDTSIDTGFDFNVSLTEIQECDIFEDTS